MICPKCNSENVNTTLEQTSGKTKVRNMGCLWGLMRLILIICTFGLWLLIGRRSKTAKTTYKSKTVCICQNCGNKWYI